MVPQLRLRRARADRVPARHDAACSRERRRSRRGRRTSRRRRELERQFREDGPLRAQRVDPGDVAAAAGHGRRRRDGLSEGNGDPAARRLQHARQPVRVDRRPEARRAAATTRSPACTSSSSTRRATTSSATGSRWTACFPDGTKLAVPPRTARRASTRCSRRRTARTSSCRRGVTARSRSPSCDGQAGARHPRRCRRCSACFAGRSSFGLDDVAARRWRASHATAAGRGSRRS